MKKIIAATAVLLVSACGDDSPGTTEPNVEPTPAEAPEISVTSDVEEETTDASLYDEATWYVSPGWPGEYPPGFSVMDEGVTVTARADMHDSLPRDISCALPQNATYQLWNNDRVEADELKFVTVSEKFDVTITEDAEIDAPYGELDNPDNILKLSAGDTITYLRYLGEGWAIMEHNGIERDVNEMELTDISDIADAGNDIADDMLWIELPCDDGARGWVLLVEALAEPGILVTPITGYGEARDLTEQDRVAAEEQAKYADEFETKD